MIKLSIERNDADQRLDRFLKKYLANAPLSYIYKIIRKDVKINGKRGKEDTVLKEGDELSLYISDDDFAKLTAVKRKTVRAKKQFKIAYEDENILVAEKPFGLLTHGDSHEKKNTLANQVIDYLIEKGDYNPRTERTFTPAPANRLDRNTTGLVIFGKNAEALRELNSMLRDRTAVSKYYITVVRGALDEELVLEDRLVKNHELNKVKVLSKDSKEGRAITTIIRPLEKGKWYSLVEAELVTGRTHQIRAHLKSAGYPLIGDSKYGDPRVNRLVADKFNLNTQLLHAYRLLFGEVEGLLSYMSGKEIKAGIPENFNLILDSLVKGKK